ncbi:Sperm-associated antigen 17, partial [Bienertia sinuspersici]
MVSDLINFERMEWEESLLESHFNERDRKCILAIIISSRVLHVELTWAFSKDGALKCRHLTEQVACPWCENTKETISHAFFECERAREVWEECGCQVLIRTDGNTDMCEMVLEWKKYEKRLWRRFGLDKVIIESDCHEIVTRLTKGATHLTDLDAILGDVLA